MPTRIVFANGDEVIVAQGDSEVVHAIRRDQPHPVTLESTTGGPLHVNWRHVALIGEVAGVALGGDGRAAESANYRERAAAIPDAPLGGPREHW